MSERDAERASPASLLVAARAVSGYLYRELQRAEAEVRRLRSLPVIASCGACGWFRGRLAIDGFCDKARRALPIVDGAPPHSTAPPPWCPMREGQR